MYQLSRGGALDPIKTKKSKRDKNYASLPEVNIPLDYRMVAVGMTGSGKTTSITSIIIKQGCFQEVHLCTKMPDEESYEGLIDQYTKFSKKTKRQHLFIYNDVTQMPLVDDFPSVPEEIPYNRLVIFDDMQGEPEKKKALMSHFWTRGRKKNFSCMFLCQNYFQAPKTIRDNSNFALFRTIGGAYDINAIIKDFGLGVEPEDFLKMFTEATQGYNFFLVDRMTRDPALKFRMNLGGKNQ